MPLVTGLLVAGAGMQVIGGIQANRAQARAERANAEFYRFQAEHAAFAGRRERNIYEVQSQRFIGSQVTAIAKAGVSFSGTALRKVVDAKTGADRELYAIDRQTDMNVRLASLRAREASRTANRLSSTSFNVIQSLGTLLNLGAQLSKTGGSSA